MGATLRLGPTRDLGGSERRKALFEEARSFIELSYGDDRLTIDSLSRNIFASRRQLQRAFADAGTSVRETLHAVRMERAAELLAEPSVHVAEIAHAVGYRQPAQFAKAFRRYHERTPSEWRTGLEALGAKPLETAA